jgi:hypothetical protein
MLDDKSEVRKLISSLVRYFESEGNLGIVEILTHSLVLSECIHYDNWNNGTYTYGLYLEIEIELYVHHRSLLPDYEREILEAVNVFLRGEANEHFGEVIIRPVRKDYVNWGVLAGKADKEDVISAIDQIKRIMIAVATGGPRIEDENKKYVRCYKTLDEWLFTLNLDNPNPHRDLWDWYSRWRRSDLSTYALRRTHVSSMYNGIIETIEKSDNSFLENEYVPTGWERVDRTVYEMRRRLVQATTEEQFQTIGMLGRETIITVAQQVYDKDIHLTDDGITPSNTDAKRMLDAYFKYELPGSSNERVRKYLKASLDLANNLTHDRLAMRRDAALCLTAVVSLVNTVKIVSHHSEQLF